MTYNLRMIMTKAHAMARKWREFQPRKTYGQLFADGLRCAWQQARDEARAAIAQTAPRTAEDIRREIVAIENMDFQGHEGRARLDSLTAELRRAA